MGGTIPQALPNIQLCIIGRGSDGLQLPVIVPPHLSAALTRERKKSWREGFEETGSGKSRHREEPHVSLPI